MELIEYKNTIIETYEYASESELVDHIEKMEANGWKTNIRLIANIVSYSKVIGA